MNDLIYLQRKREKKFQREEIILKSVLENCLGNVFVTNMVKMNLVEE